AFKHQDLTTSGHRRIHFGMRRPALEPHGLLPIPEQRRRLYAGTSGLWRERQSIGVPPNTNPVVRVELPELDEQRAPWCRTWRMRRGRWIAHIRAGREVTVLVLE